MSALYCCLIHLASFWFTYYKENSVGVNLKRSGDEVERYISHKSYVFDGIANPSLRSNVYR
jgi:hypothetical protein